MPKRKADTLNQLSSTTESKKAKHNAIARVEKPNLWDSDSGRSSEDESIGGAKLEETEFKINEEYAKRFEYNKKREELHKLEEKYQNSAKPVKGQYGDKYDEDSESSGDEDEDDDGFLATEALDAEISATLQAIRSKDPRVYNDKITFYAPIEEDEDLGEGIEGPKVQKPMYLRDYHRENLLKGYTGGEEVNESASPRTFAEEQIDLKKNIVKEIYAAVDHGSGSNSDEEFIVPKSKPQIVNQSLHQSRAPKIATDFDNTAADKDPDTFLSNFMAARAWVPSDGARFQPLESDDEEEDERAEKFEAAYNLRFEDPEGSNEMLKSYARDIVAAKSVRREDTNSRKKQREAQREKKDAEKRQRDVEKARLRRLKVEEMEERLQMIKKAAGIRGEMLKDEEWTKFLDDGWDNDDWEAEMNKRFGEDYYAGNGIASDDDTDEATANGQIKKRKVKKPKWDDDIDIKDLIPEFQEEEKLQTNPAFTLSDSDDGNEDRNEAASGIRSKSSRDRHQEKLAKKAARIERKKIEDLVDSRLDIDDSILPLNSSKQVTRFRYRETSPTSFGLTARDILMAPEASLNEFAGLKKLATFRDVHKKRKDKKHLGKKARLRQWRKETFGNEDGPEMVVDANAADVPEPVDNEGGIQQGKRKKRSRKNRG